MAEKIADIVIMESHIMLMEVEKKTISWNLNKNNRNLGAYSYNNYREENYSKYHGINCVEFYKCNNTKEETIHFWDCRIKFVCQF